MMYECPQLRHQLDGSEIFGGVCEVATDWHQSPDAAMAAAKAAIDSGGFNDAAR